MDLLVPILDQTKNQILHVNGYLPPGWRQYLPLLLNRPEISVAAGGVVAALGVYARRRKRAREFEEYEQDTVDEECSTDNSSALCGPKELKCRPNKRSKLTRSSNTDGNDAVSCENTTQSQLSNRDEKHGEGNSDANASCSESESTGEDCLMSTTEGSPRADESEEEQVEKPMSDDEDSIRSENEDNGDSGDEEMEVSVADEAGEQKNGSAELEESVELDMDVEAEEEGANVTEGSSDTATICNFTEKQRDEAVSHTLGTTHIEPLDICTQLDGSSHHGDNEQESLEDEQESSDDEESSSEDEHDSSEDEQDSSDDDQEPFHDEQDSLESGMQLRKSSSGEMQESFDDERSQASIDQCDNAQTQNEKEPSDSNAPNTLPDGDEELTSCHESRGECQTGSDPSCDGSKAGEAKQPAHQAFKDNNNKNSIPVQCASQSSVVDLVECDKVESVDLTDAVESSVSKFCYSTSAEPSNVSKLSKNRINSLSSDGYDYDQSESDSDTSDSSRYASPKKGLGNNVKLHQHIAKLSHKSGMSSPASTRSNDEDTTTSHVTNATSAYELAVAHRSSFAAIEMPPTVDEVLEEARDHLVSLHETAARIGNSHRSGPEDKLSFGVSCPTPESSFSSSTRTIEAAAASKFGMSSRGLYHGHNLGNWSRRGSGSFGSRSDESEEIGLFHVPSSIVEQRPFPSTAAWALSSIRNIGKPKNLGNSGNGKGNPDQVRSENRNSHNSVCRSQREGYGTSAVIQTTAQPPIFFQTRRERIDRSPYLFAHDSTTSVDEPQ